MIGSMMGCWKQLRWFQINHWFKIVTYCMKWGGEFKSVFSRLYKALHSDFESQFRASVKFCVYKLHTHKAFLPLSCFHSISSLSLFILILRTFLTVLFYLKSLVKLRLIPLIILQIQNSLYLSVTFLHTDIMVMFLLYITHKIRKKVCYFGYPSPCFHCHQKRHNNL